MKKQIGAIFLLAGAAIGSGMISLPIVLARLGIIHSFILMLLFAFLTYVTAIIRSDLNLKSKPEFSLKEVGKFFGSNLHSRIGDVSIKVLSHALISAYIFGLSSIFNSSSNSIFSQKQLILAIAILLIVLLCFSSNFIISINKYLFIIMTVTLFLLIIFLSCNTKIIEFPIKAIKTNDLNLWACLIPIAFTSFGFQGSIHSMTKFVNNDIKLIKRACLFGTLIPTIVYVTWTCCILLIIFNTDKTFFNQMILGKVEVGELVKFLSNVFKFDFFENIVSIVSSLAIITSIIGVGISLFDIYVIELKNIKNKRIFSSLLTTFPSLIIALTVPNAFIKVLNFAGMILSIIAIILPVLLHKKIINRENLLINNSYLINSVFVIGIVIIIFGLIF